MSIDTWQAALAIVAVGLLFSIGWQLGMLVYTAVLSHIRRLRSD